MRKMKMLLLTLGLVFTSLSAFAGGAFELVAKPVDEVASAIARHFKIPNEEASVLASTIVKGFKVAAGDSEPTTEAAFRAIIARDADLAAAFAKIGNKDLKELTEREIGELANDIGAKVNTLAKAADLCQTCGISETLINKFGLKIYIPVSVDAPMKTLVGVPSDPSVLVKRISSNRLVKTKSGALLASMKSDSEHMMSALDLRKIQKGLDCADGSCGPEAQAYVRAALKLGDGDVAGDSRLIATTAALLEDPQGKSVMDEMSKVMDNVSKEHKTPKDRRIALCKHYSAKAKGTASKSDDTAFKNLKGCPNYAAIFGSCE